MPSASSKKKKKKKNLSAAQVRDVGRSWPRRDICTYIFNLDPSVRMYALTSYIIYNYRSGQCTDYMYRFTYM